MAKEQPVFELTALLDVAMDLTVGFFSLSLFSLLSLVFRRRLALPAVSARGIGCVHVV